MLFTGVLLPVKRIQVLCHESFSAVARQPLHVLAHKQLC
jgi:hypothetical protein